MSITLFTEDQSNQSTLYYPGLANVGSFWANNIYTFFADWDPRANNAALEVAERSMVGEMVGETLLGKAASSLPNLFLDIELTIQNRRR